ncbi:MAG: ABC transporter substrate-binding protein [Dehalococcoidia bacterium]
MFKSSRLVLLVIAAFMVFGLSFVACGGSSNNTASTGGGTPSSGAFPTPVPGPGVGDTIGVTDTSVKIGTLLPISNTTAAAWGVPEEAAMKAWFQYVNDNGGIYGRKIDLDIGDSQYTGTVGTETARKLVEQDGIFAMMGTIGIEVELGVMPYLQDKGIPDMFIQASESATVDPISYQRYRWLPDYTKEGDIIGKYIGENYKDQKVGILAQNDSFGKAGEAGVKQGLSDAGSNSETTTQYYDATQSDVTAQMQRLKADGAQVIALYAQPGQAAGAITDARTTLSWDVPFFMTGVNAAQIMGALAGYNNIQGAVTVSFGPQSDETDIAGVQDFVNNMKKYQPDAAINSIAFSAYALAQAMTAVLIQTGPDLTRTNFLKAAQSICRWDNGAVWTPKSLSPTDHDWNESEVLVKATGTSADDFKWVPFGDVIDFETTQNCTAPTEPADASKQPGYAPQGIAQSMRPTPTN